MEIKTQNTSGDGNLLRELRENLVNEADREGWLEDAYGRELISKIDAALAAPAAKGGPDWHTMAERPRSGSKIVALYDDGSGAVMLYIHDGGAIDCEGFDIDWPDRSKFDRWAYLPADVEFHCETGEEPFTFPVEPPPAGTAGGGSGDLAALSARTIYFLRQLRQCSFGEDHGTPAVIYRDPSYGKDCWINTESKALLEALVATSSPAPDLGAQGEPVAEILKLLREGFNSDDTQTKNWSLQSAHDKLASFSAPVAPSEPVEEPVEFDAGYLPNSGRDADQWHDAIRQLLASAHDHYVEQFRELAAVAQGEPVAKHHGAAVIAGLAELIPLIDDLGAVAMGFVQSEPTPDKAKLLMGAIDRLLHKRDTLDFDEAPAAPRSGSGVTVAKAQSEDIRLCSCRIGQCHLSNTRCRETWRYDW